MALAQRMMRETQQGRRARSSTPEQDAGALRRGLMQRGSATREAGRGAIQSFDSSDFLSADALGSLFEQAGRTTFMPQLRGLQARNSRRGIRGPLAGALEGDLAGSFRRDLMAQAGRFAGQRANFAFQRGQALSDIGGEDRAQGISLLGTELELQMAREQAERERKQKRKSGIGSIVGGVAGGLAGSFIPGLGTGIGASIGARLGGSVA